MITRKSEALDSRLRAVMPGGNTRAATFYAPFPIAFEEGYGCHIRDIDGNEFIDLLNNYTSLIHGHGHPDIIRAIVDQAHRGIVFPAPNHLQGELAERICRRIPSIEQLRFTNSGTEAVMMAVRAARAYTGRDHIIKAAGGYHGAWEQVAMASSADELKASPDAFSKRPRRTGDAGIPKVVRELVHMVSYNSPDELEAAIRAHGSEVAAILLEPVIGEETVPGDLDFLQLARDLATECGAVLIFDEVVTARLHEGGVQTSIGIAPDLTTLGKIIGGGLPVGAVGGSAEIMSIFDPRQPDYVPHHGTFNGNLLTMAAGCVSLDLLPAEEIERINRLGEQLAAGLTSVFSEANSDFSVTGVGSLVLVHAPDLSALLRFHQAGLEEGLYFAPRGLMNISTPMDGDVIEEVLTRANRSVARVRERSVARAAG